MPVHMFISKTIKSDFDGFGVVMYVQFVKGN